MTSALLNPRDPARIEDYADMLRSVLDGRTATYLSVPITTGRRFIEWFAREGHRLDAAGTEYREQHARQL